MCSMKRTRLSALETRLGGHRGPHSRENFAHMLGVMRRLSARFTQARIEHAAWGVRVQAAAALAEADTDSWASLPSASSLADPPAWLFVALAADPEVPSPQAELAALRTLANGAQRARNNFRSAALAHAPVAEWPSTLKVQQEEVQGAVTEGASFIAAALALLATLQAEGSLSMYVAAGKDVMRLLVIYIDKLAAATECRLASLEEFENEQVSPLPSQFQPEIVTRWATWCEYDGAPGGLPSPPSVTAV
jgi:hypothetical protein